jgi:uncharacterized protein (DUF1800 family)
MSAAPPLPIIALNRLAFGPTAESVAELQKAGLGSWIDRQLAPDDSSDTDVHARLPSVRLLVKYPASEKWPAVDDSRPLLHLDRPIESFWSLADGRNPIAGAERQMPWLEVAAATLLRAAHSRWQLREVLCDFWHNHFNVDASRNHMVSAALPAYDRDVIRAHCLGNFRELLEAVATSAAMLVYLNNRSSRAGSANENYARELLELHTLGRGAYLNTLYDRWRDVPGATEGHPQGYIDQDVYEAARAFTGWTIADGAGLGGGMSLPATGAFTYVEAWHDGYQKRVLGHEFDPFQAPMADGRKVLDLVADHPATAWNVCTRLACRLVADRPPESLVKAAVQVWIENRRKPDQIAQVVRAIALSREFAETWGRKVKRPLEVVASFARATGIDLIPTSGLISELNNSGQRLFGWAAPNGHPDDMAYWLGGPIMLRRWSLLLGLAENWWKTGVFTPSERLSGPDTVGAVAREWQRVLAGYEPPDRSVDAILAGMRLNPDARITPDGKDADAKLRRIVAYTAMAPWFHLR